MTDALGNQARLNKIAEARWKFLVFSCFSIAFALATFALFIFSSNTEACVYSALSSGFFFGWGQVSLYQAHLYERKDAK